jgi:hypothetical protein
MSTLKKTEEIITELRSNHRNACDSYYTLQIREDFTKVLEIFIEANYQDGMEESTLMCSIHDSFPRHHSCIACNLQENARLVERFLLYPYGLTDIHYACTTLLMLLYLLVERINEYLAISNVPESYKKRHFQVFQEIKQWANFLKHPKSFMLVLHPQWTYQGSSKNENDYVTKERVIIDSAFVNEYYRSDENKLKLYKTLARKDDVVVTFPNPVELMRRFTEAQLKFVKVIAENEMVREMLESETMVKEHFVPSEATPAK